MTHITATSPRNYTVAHDDALDLSVPGFPALLFPTITLVVYALVMLTVFTVVNVLLMVLGR